MANYIDQMTSDTVYGDTEIAAVNFDLSLLRTFIAVPTAFTAGITEANAADLLTFLQGKLEADDRGDRWYKFPTFVNLEDGSEAAGSESFNYGTSVMTTRGAPKFTMRFTDGGATTNKVMSEAWHNKQSSYNFYGVYDNALVGREVRAKDGTLTIHPWKMQQIFVNRPGAATSSATSSYTITFAFASDRVFNEDFGFIRLDEGVNLTSDLRSLILVKLQGAQGSPTGHHLLVKAFAGAGDMRPDYGTELAAAGMWVLTNATTGATVTPSAVTATATGWDFTTPAATSDKINVKMAAPSVLEAGGVIGFASDSIQIVAP